MFARRWVSIFALFLMSLTSGAYALDNGRDQSVLEVEEVRLEVGQQKVLSADGVRSYSEGTRGVVDVRLTRDAKQFVLVAVKEGATTVLFLMMDGSERHVRVIVGDGGELLVQASSDTIVVTKAENIRLDFYFVQLDRSYRHQLGPAYPQSATIGPFSSEFDFLTQSFTSATAVVENQALLRLDIAQTTGWAKLMRQAAVITQNGQAAKFLGGGEVNIPVVGSLTTGIHKIEFGSTLQVLPRYDSETGRLQIELGADVSDLTDDRGSGVPGRLISSLQTIVNVELGQTIVLAGLSAQSELRSQSGLPFLSQIPILGHLFSTHRRDSSEIENVIFIVPSVIDTPSAETRAVLADALSTFESYRGKPAGLARLRAKRGHR